ncbi:MAG: universal stress protein [Flavobacteriaceae bacterium]
MLKILLPTDFSANSWNAISYAVNFYKDRECMFYILHTYTPAFYRMDYLVGGPSFSAIPDVGVEISMGGLDKTLADIEKQFPNPRHSFKKVSAFNLLTDEINYLAGAKAIDMVIMGTQGATGAKEIFLGTNTVYVIRKSTIPVLVIPKGFKYKSLKKILFPTDYLSQYKKEELRTLTDKASSSAAEITILHVKEEYELTENQTNNKQYIGGLLEEFPHSFEELRGVLMPQAIMDYVDEQQVDLLVMMNRQHSFLERLLWRQNIDQIGFHVQVPFLVIRDTSKITK